MLFDIEDLALFEELMEDPTTQVLDVEMDETLVVLQNGDIKMLVEREFMETYARMVLKR